MYFREANSTHAVFVLKLRHIIKFMLAKLLEAAFQRTLYVHVLLLFVAYMHDDYC